MRAFTGGLIVTSGITLAASGSGKVTVAGVTVLISAAVKLIKPAELRQWHSPFLTGLGLGCLVVGTLTFVRPYDNGKGREWACFLLVGAFAYWVLPRRRGRPAFLLTALVAAMLVVTAANPALNFDPSERISQRFFDSLDPSPAGLVIFALGYTLAGVLLDQRRRHGAAGTFFVAAAIAVLWASFDVEKADRALVAATLVTAVVLLVCARGGGRFYVRTAAIAALSVAMVKFLQSGPVLPGTDFEPPSLPWTVQAGIVIAIVGFFVGRGARAE